MKRALKPRNSGPMDNFVKKMADIQTGVRQNRPPNLSLHEKRPTENEAHDTHSFKWQWKQRTPTALTCNTAGTVEDVLKKSSQFCTIAKENKEKELVILKGGKAVSSHFPCCLIRDEHLIVKFINISDCKKKSIISCPQRKVRPEELVTFHVKTQGGKKIFKVMKNPRLRTIVSEITVYGYKGETVKQALKRDDRFTKFIFRKNCALSDIGIEVTTEMSSLVDDLEGKTFKIFLLDQCPAPESQPGSLDDADLTQKQSDESEHSPLTAGPTQSVSENPSESKPNHATVEKFRKIPNSEMMQVHLSKQFKEWTKQVKRPNVSKRSLLQNLLDVEYGKNAQACSEVKTMKTLMHLADSVCQVRINGSPGGSGFLLFGKFVLTNAHVVRPIYDENTGHFRETITVHFSFESLNERESGVEVEEITGFEYSVDVSGDRCDWALLKLRPEQTLPERLLKYFQFLPQCGGICIIGHPNGSVKRTDPCFIVPCHEQKKVVEKHTRENPEDMLVDNADYSGSNTQIQLVTHNFFNNVEKSVEQNRKTLTYQSCFYYGSSGSPVFDRHCNVVAMHTGGYTYYDAKGKLQSVIEYGHPLSDILEQMIIQIVTREKWDVLKEYLAFNYTQQEHIMGNVKKLVQSRNLIAFRNALKNSAVASDEKCKALFEFITQSEEPLPMDTN